MSEKIVHVSTKQRPYDVHVGTELLGEVGAIARDVCAGEAACVVSDSTVAPLYAGTVLDSLAAAGFDATLVTFPAGERNKRLSTMSDLLEEVAESGLTRDDAIVALGGGVTGDMGGFCAASYLRGIQVVQVPTSLLAMVDSSVGGKVAVDLEHGKNLAGAFWQPSAVIADVDCLASLDHALLTDSCGEVVKHAVLADGDLLDSLTASPLNGPDVERSRMVDVVTENVDIKREVVDADETEHGVRQTLNLGHTIGHAVEAASDFSLGHGTCVAIGMCCMARATEALGWSSHEATERITAAVSAHGMPTDTALDHDTLFRFATHDKKRHGDGMNVCVARDVEDVIVRRISLAEFRHLVDLGCGV